MKKKKIVITGGPGTGKSSVIQNFETMGYNCLHEVSREITSQAQKEGIEQLFLEKPILFSEKLLEARIKQYTKAESKHSHVFLDRGIPDVVAYMDYLGTSYQKFFSRACREYKYDLIFLLPPWKKIYQTDSERYESFEQAMEIHEYLKKTYINFGYDPIEVPRESIEFRTEFILNTLDV